MDGLPCDSCGNFIPNGTKVPAIQWMHSPPSFFCNEDCRFDWMAANNASFVNPAAQPDIDANLH